MVAEAAQAAGSGAPPAVAGQPGSLGSAPSLMTRIAQAASSCREAQCPGGGERCETHFDQLRSWLALGLSAQVDDLRRFIAGGGGLSEPWLSVEAYRCVSPRSAPDSCRRLFLCCIEAALATLEEQRKRKGGPSDAHVSIVLALVDGENGRLYLALKELAYRRGLSPAHLGRLVRQRTGVSFHRYQRLLRVRRAVELLRDPARKIKSISESLGYDEPTHFNRDFRKALGVSPGEFRQAVARGDAASLEHT